MTLPVAGVALSPATLDDLDALETLVKVSQPVPLSRAGLEAELRQALALVRVAKHDNRLVGYITAWQVIDVVEIHNIAVHVDYRRHGLGRALLNHVLDEAQQAGARSALLEVRKSNLPAQALYRSLGFKEIGQRRAYYQDNREDALVFEKRLG
jgi:ribosomal-protein-alanine N-acetyltransferase